MEYQTDGNDGQRNDGHHDDDNTSRAEGEMCKQVELVSFRAKQVAVDRLKSFEPRFSRHGMMIC